MNLTFGAQFLEEAIVYTTESESSPGQLHYTMLLRDGQLICSCKGWQYTGGCKHTKAFALDAKGNAVLDRWLGLTHNQAFVLNVLTKGSATAKDQVWWPLRHDQVRGLLRRLRQAGYVEVTGYRRSAHVYSITDGGMAVLQAHQQIRHPQEGEPPVWI
jgi:hypothetical protein